MPKSLPPTGRSKIRFFFVEADLAPGEMHQLTTALSAAIRPTSQMRRTDLLAVDVPATKVGAEPEVEEDIAPESSTEEAPRAAEGTETRSPRGPRKYRSPKPVDLDMEAGGKPFEKFAIEKGSPKDHVTRYLVAASWLEQYAKIPTVTVDHIFTCCKSADWNFDP